MPCLGTKGHFTGPRGLVGSLHTARGTSRSNALQVRGWLCALYLAEFLPHTLLDEYETIYKNPECSLVMIRQPQHLLEMNLSRGKL